MQPITAPQPRIVVALPAYNEEGNLANLLRHIHQTLRDAGLEHSIVVVDDGSRDHTAEILRSCAQTLPLIIETHTRNQGLGGALRDALKRAVTGAARKPARCTGPQSGLYAFGETVLSSRRRRAA